MGLPLAELAGKAVKTLFGRKDAGIEAAQEVEATKRRLEIIKKAKVDISNNVHPVPLEDKVPEKFFPTSTKHLSEKDKLVSELLKRRDGIKMFLNSPDSTGTSQTRDAAEIQKIDRRLQELGYKPEGEQKAA